MSENTECRVCCNLMAKVYLSCRIFIMKLNVYIQHKLHINTLFPFPTFLLQYFNSQHTIQTSQHVVFMLISIRYYSHPAALCLAQATEAGGQAAEVPHEAPPAAVAEATELTAEATGSIPRPSHACFCWGFGGKMVACFPPGGSDANSAPVVQTFDVADVIGDDALVSSVRSFPGPVEAATPKHALVEYACAQRDKHAATAPDGGAHVLWSLLHLLCRS